LLHVRGNGVLGQFPLMGKTYRRDEFEGRRSGAACDAADKRQRFEGRKAARDAKRWAQDLPQHARDYTAGRGERGRR